MARHFTDPQLRDQYEGEQYRAAQYREPEAKSRFVASLVNARQEQLAGLFSVGLVQVGLRVRLKTGATVVATHHDAGVKALGTVQPGDYEVFRLDNTPDGRQAVLLALPARGSLKGPDLYVEHFVQVALGGVLRGFKAIAARGVEGRS